MRSVLLGVAAATLMLVPAVSAAPRAVAHPYTLEAAKRTVRAFERWWFKGTSARPVVGRCSWRAWDRARCDVSLTTVISEGQPAQSFEWTVLVVRDSACWPVGTDWCYAAAKGRGLTVQVKL